MVGTPPVGKVLDSMRSGTVRVAAVLSLLAGRLLADEPRPARIFTDHMVLQRDMPVPVWGWADPGARVRVSFGGQEKNATADADGRWLVRLDAMPATAESRALTISADGATHTLDDVLVGDVWLASGQSNMGFSIAGSTERDAAHELIPHPTLRWFKVGTAIGEKPVADLAGAGSFTEKRWRAGDENQWRVVTTDRFGIDWISAVGAWFAHGVRTSQQVPVGLVVSVFGGSKLHCWMPHESLAAVPEFKADLLDASLRERAKWEAARAAWEADPKHDPAKPPTEPWRPACIYNAMIHPLAPIALRGVIWYQGESDVGRGEPYRRQLPAMVRSWREAFERDDLAFLAVQLPGINKIREHPKSAYSEVRESISLLPKALPHTATVAINDCGIENEIHPPLKRAVGERLALAARATVYGERIEWSGPTFRDVEFADGKALVRFDHVGAGLVARDGPLVGFTLAGVDQKFFPAAATIEGDSVGLQSDEVSAPVAVRYAWADFPVANLWNADGLSAGTFRSDDWPLQTQRKQAAP